jgi:L-galactose dehydrogenase/L-glyceraldehyde 3-phosphate reductase
MDYRTLGRTGLRVGVLGFGCGNVGGLLIRGTPAERERAVARALELGINYFDTAPLYGDGQSETNLGQVLRTLKPRLYVGTKFRVPDVPASGLASAVVSSLEASLKRLGLERVDLLQCHNLVTREHSARSVSVKDMRDAIVPALVRLVEQGKIGFYGMTALGETAALHEVLDAAMVQTAQVCFNLLNPSAARALPPRFPAQDFGRLLDHAEKSRTGVIVIRVLAAGALSGTEARHPVAVPTVEPISTAPEYAVDVRRARLLEALVKEGHAVSLVEASLRFALTSAAISTVLLGYSSLEHLENAAAAIAKGPLSDAALARLPALWAQFAEG